MIEIGTVVHDQYGSRWVYIGYRVTSLGTHSHSFVRVMTGGRENASLPWVYSAVNVDTIRRKFVDLPAMEAPTTPA